MDIFKIEQIIKQCTDNACELLSLSTVPTDIKRVCIYRIVTTLTENSSYNHLEIIAMYSETNAETIIISKEYSKLCNTERNVKLEEDWTPTMIRAEVSNALVPTYPADAIVGKIDLS